MRHASIPTGASRRYLRFLERDRRLTNRDVCICMGAYCLSRTRAISPTNPIDAARVELLLAELRLPAVKLVWADLATQADKEGWPAARFLAALTGDGRRAILDQYDTTEKGNVGVIADSLCIRRHWAAPSRGGAPPDRCCDARGKAAVGELT